MTEETIRREKAAAWLARLRSRTVTTDELAEFARWRRDPANTDAYRAAEAMWEASDGLGGDSDIVNALDAARRRRWAARLLNRPMHRWLALGAGLAAAVVAIAVFALPSATRTYTTVVGERSFAKLEDGSKIQLDTDTALTANLHTDGRQIDLTRGQAFFDVHHDPSRPFVVNTGDVTVTALGTRFDVAALDNATVVSLLDGRVSVATNHTAPVVLSPGQSVRITAGVIGAVTSGRAADLTSWREGRLSFRDTPLSQAIAAMNRYTDRPITISSGSLGAEPISGDFSTDDVDGFVSAVRTLFGSTAVTRQDEAK